MVNIGGCSGFRGGAEGDVDGAADPSPQLLASNEDVSTIPPIDTQARCVTQEIVKCGFWRKLPLLWHTNAVDEN